MTLRFPLSFGDSRRIYLSLAAVGLVTLTGCAASRPHYELPQAPLPAKFQQPLPTAGAPTGGAGRVDTVVLTTDRLREWWRLLGDPTLDALIDRALANNAELHIATARIEQGWARAHQANAQRYPTVGLSYSAIAQKANTYTVGTPNTAGTPAYHVLQLATSLDLDPWGARRSTAESAAWQLSGMSLARDDARRTLVANAVGLYVDYLSLNDRIRIAKETAKVLQDMQDAVESRMKGGEATATDYEQQRAAVHSVLATVPVLELQRETTANALALLLGVPPSALTLPPDRGLGSLHYPVVSPGAPAELLLNRPDIRAAESRLRAAHADVDAARAKLLPTVGLSGQAGYGSQWLSSLIGPGGFYWNAIANLAATLFDGGAREDDVDFAAAVHEELVEQYVQTMYGALRESEDALAAVHYGSARLSEQTVAWEAAQNAWKNSKDAYSAGAVDFLTLLDTQRTYFTNFDALQSATRDRYKGLVSLFAALGGGTTFGRQDDADGAIGRSTDEAGDRMPLKLVSSRAATLHARAKGDGDGRYVVAIAGLQDDDGVDRVTRDLAHRFAPQMQGRHVVARQYGELDGPRNGHPAWYRVFVAGFPAENDARTFCDAISAQMQRCKVMDAGDAAFRKGRRRAQP